jgi:hypothetical protein
MQTGTTLKVAAGSVKEGDSIPGLDNGYVYEDAQTENLAPYYDGRFAIARSADTVSIGFHTADGDEAEILCPGTMPLTVECPDPDAHDHGDWEAWSLKDDDDDDDEDGES